MLDLKKFIEDVHSNAVNKGFWDDKNKTFGDIISLMHSELSEALEFKRISNSPAFKEVDVMFHYSNKNGEVSKIPNGDIEKPDGILAELADVVIRIFDYVGHEGKVEEFIEILKLKHEYNTGRPYMHGKTF